MAHQGIIPRFKIVLVGDGGVGKSTFIKRFLDDGGFQPTYVATLGVDVHPILLKTNYGNIVFDIWDTAGQEKFCGLMDGYYVQGKGCIAMFDMSSLISLRNLSKWVDMYEQINPNTPVFICGSKLDVSKQSISAQTYSQKLQNRGIACAYGEICTKTKTNINAPFLWLVRELTKHPDLIFIE